MNYYKKRDEYIASELNLDLEKVTEAEYLHWAEQKKAKQELMVKLDALDLKCIRALRAIQAGNGTADDTAKLEALEAQAEEIRQQLQLLGE